MRLENEWIILENVKKKCKKVLNLEMNEKEWWKKVKWKRKYEKRIIKEWKVEDRKKGKKDGYGKGLNKEKNFEGG